MITEPVISYFQALRSLVPDAKLYVEDNDWEKVNWSDDRQQPTKSEVDAEVDRLQAESDALKYQRDRQYPSWQEQMDMQYHDKLNGTTTWKDAVAKVKSDNPKG